MIDDEESWNLVGRDLRLKATFLYIDLSRVISSCGSDECKKTLTRLANKFLYFMDEVMITCFPLLATFGSKHVLFHCKFTRLPYWILQFSQYSE